MLGFNWIDLVILVLLFLAVWRGTRVNFWSQLFTIAGFFIGFLLTSWLVTITLRSRLSATNLVVLRTNTSIIVGVFGAVVGNSLGYRVHWYFTKGDHHRLATSLSVVFSVFSVLIAAWLLAATIGRLPFEGLSNSANDAKIVQFLDRALPSQPGVFSTLDRYVNPNNPPRVFSSSESKPGEKKLKTTAVTSAQKITENSVVRITSFGCGGIVSGSGFVVAPELVITNAHVLAGVRRPIVKYKDDSLEATPVYFDALKDVAILRASGLKAPAVELETGRIADGSAILVVGYPNGNFSAAQGVVASRLTAYGQSIYGVGPVGRDIYELQADIEHGNSGGPVVLEDGRVAGMIFSKSETMKDIGYALSAQSLSLSVLQVLTSSKRVGTGVCAS